MFGVAEITDFELNDDTSFKVFFRDGCGGDEQDTNTFLLIAYDENDQEDINNKIIEDFENECKKLGEEYLQRNKEKRLKMYEQLKKEFE